ncbi:RNA polymerase sigma factor [Fulvivirga maritima]|uniref:RNA polymerase sigma factor n=1 Tax=Fulvivirga maritima TaxID=2904247 RepID=UPI001F3130FB|nr:RNA polymerase sigma factor [Fulvivirga maritima]UII29173.1 RNA polymerase sigma factor [Fulvivirga maritima]
MITDEMLMSAVKNGDLKQASFLFDRYSKQLYNFFVKITLDRDLGNDLTQNVFLRMLKYRSSYREDKSFKSWIYQMARNVYADHYRKNKMLFSDFSEAENLMGTMAAADENIEAGEQEKLLYASLFKLKPEQREIIILTKFQGLKYEEVGNILDCTVANVKVRVYRAMKDLKEKFMQLEGR